VLNLGCISCIQCSLKYIVTDDRGVSLSASLSVCISMAGGHNQIYEKDHRGSGLELNDILLIFLDPLVALDWRKIDTASRAVCVVHSMQPSPNYFGLLLCFEACFILLFKFICRY